MTVQRGRKSAAKLAVVSPLPGERYEPPADLTPEQAKVWREVVATKPQDWFTADSWPLLCAYCRSTVTVNLLCAQIDSIERGSIDDPKLLAAYAKLLTMRNGEVKSLILLATAMRITQYSRLKPDTAATQHNNAGGSGKPWQAAS